VLKNSLILTVMNVIPLQIDSGTRTDFVGTTSSDFVVNLSQRVVIKSWTLEWIEIPLTMWNITSRNNVISFTEDSILKTATIPVGPYNGSSLASAIKTAMDTASGGYNTFTVTYNPDNYTLSFVASPNQFQLNCSRALFPARECGFLPVDTSFGTTITSTQVISLERPHSIVVSIKELDNAIITGHASVNGVFVVPITENIGAVQFYRPKAGRVSRILQQPIYTNTLAIKLCDFGGRLIDLNGSNWTMSLTITS
jgi:hypothetical protein